MSVLSFASCVSDDIEQEVMVDNDAITLQLYTGANVSRAIGDPVADEAHEYALSHLDVFIFNSNESKFHYERIATTDALDGTVTLSGKTKSEFTQDTSYWVYVVANSSKTVADMEAVQNLDGLKALTQTDVNIHLSGLALDNVPKFFLMDGIAYKGESEPTTAAAITINDGTSVGTTVLKVNLRRAAAKVKVVLTAGDKVEFFKNDYVGYYLRNMPTVTSLLAESPHTNTGTDLVDTRKTASAYFKGKYKGQTYNGEEYNGNGELTIIAYVYAHNWSKATNPWETQTNLVVNIPVHYDTGITGENQTVTYDQSYYQIELGKDHKFERNHYYLITGTINAPGAEEFTEPIELQGMKYSAMDWTNVTVNVGGETKPTYLKVNKDILRIYNQIQDDNITYNTDESLVFASSSPITLSIKNENNTPTPYYINKFGVETYVSPTTYHIGATDLTAGGLAGNIQVKSDIPQNNAVRYFTLIVSNEDGLSVEVLVEQYPVIYITNVLGYYSYRSDFKSTNGEVTTYESGNSPYYTRAHWNSNNNSWTHSVGYENTTDAFFRSKVNTYTHTSTQNNQTHRGKSNLAYYRWAYIREGRWNDELVVHSSVDDDLAYKTYNGRDEQGNARMYHIHVTATSGDYTIGRPRLDVNGYPVQSEDNARLVSPSFYIASQLGATKNPSEYLQAVTHCANYVETYKKEVRDANGNLVLDQNGNNTGEIVHLDDWRLPTAAEVEIIMAHQYGTTGTNSADAMDEVLAGSNYYCVNPIHDNIVDNTRVSGNSVYVRCVRDAY